MPLDEYAKWMLDNGYYDVDIETGQLTNPRTGKILTGAQSVQGYNTINMVFNRKIVRDVLLEIANDHLQDK